MPGDVVSYFSGTKIFYSNMLFLNMTNTEISSAYFFNLAANMPDWRDYPVLDVPERTTLGHKANHLFEGKNTESYYDTVNHPVHVHGDIVCLIAKRMTSLTEE